MGLTVREHVVLGYRVRNERNRLWSDLFTAGALHHDSTDEKERVDYLVDLLGLTSVANTPAASLPLGTARRVEVARALATGPSVVLLDEPSSGLDAHETSQLGAALRRVVDERRSRCCSSSTTSRWCWACRARDPCSTSASASRKGTPDAIRADPAVRAAYLGDDEAVEGTSGSETSDADVSDASRKVEPSVSESLLSVEGLNVRYGSVQALFDVSLDVPERLGRRGARRERRGQEHARAHGRRDWSPRSGARSSSAARTSPSGTRTASAARAWCTSRRVGGSFPACRWQENLRMAVRRVGTGDQRKAAIANAYEMFPVLADRRGQRAGTLSGGEQQMLALARALAVPPRLIIADEMSLGLAPLVVDFVFESIERASKSGVTIVLIEQFIHRALSLASECVILRQGSVAWTGPSENARQEVLDRYLGEAADAMS